MEKKLFWCTIPSPCKLVIVAILSDTIQVDNSKLVFFSVGVWAHGLETAQNLIRLRQERNDGAEVTVPSKLMVVYVTVGKLE